jgi:CTP:molybdopterin cytidylyltransferase MocA
MAGEHEAVILAAGPATGFGSLTTNKHKCMLDVGGTTIIEHQIENLMLAGIPSRRLELQRGDDDARRPRHCAGEPRLQRRHPQLTFRFLIL